MAFHLITGLLLLCNNSRCNLEIHLDCTAVWLESWPYWQRNLQRASCNNTRVFRSLQVTNRKREREKKILSFIFIDGLFGIFFVLKTSTWIIAVNSELFEIYRLARWNRPISQLLRKWWTKKTVFRIDKSKVAILIKTARMAIISKLIILF